MRYTLPVSPACAIDTAVASGGIRVLLASEVVKLRNLMIRPAKVKG